MTKCHQIIYLDINICFQLYFFHNRKSETDPFFGKEITKYYQQIIYKGDILDK